MKHGFALGAAMIALTTQAQAADFLNPGPGTHVLNSATYTQNFNTLESTGQKSTLPSGWQGFERGSTNVPELDGNYTGGTSSAAPGLKSYGTTFPTVDRALGSLVHSGLTEVYFGVLFENGLGGTIDSLDIAYTGEQWFNNGSIQTPLKFEYSLDATAINNGTWTSFSTLDFLGRDATATSGRRDGNAAAYRTALNGSIGGLAIADGSTFALRWTQTYNGVGSGDGLAVDDFRMTANMAAVPEPATWALMIAGLGAIGFTMRRRNASTTVRYA